MKVLVTGAGSGIGKQIYQDLSDSGHQPYGIGLEGPDCEVDFEQASDGFLGDLVHEKGPFRGLVNCAGTIELASLASHMPYQFNRVIRINLEIPYVLSRAFYLSTREQTDQPEGTFRVVNISSMAVRIPGRECPGYSASKAGLEAMTRAMAKELAGTAWCFACVAPGSVGGTEMDAKGALWLQNKRGMSSEDVEAYVNGLYGRQIFKSEVSRIVQFALFEMPPTMTGTVLTMPAGSGL